jgi:hypothetical protein
MVIPTSNSSSNPFNASFDVVCVDNGDKGVVLFLP